MDVEDDNNVMRIAVLEQRPVGHILAAIDCFAGEGDLREFISLGAPDIYVNMPGAPLVPFAGEYRGAFAAKEPGVYTVNVMAEHGGKTIDAQPVFVSAEEPRDEFYGSQMRAPLLRRIADETGGRFYTASNAAGLPEDLQYTGRGVTTIEERELWHMPIVLLTLLALMGGEWALRRRQGLA